MRRRTMLLALMSAVFSAKFSLSDAEPGSKMRPADEQIKLVRLMNDPARAAKDTDPRVLEIQIDKRIPNGMGYLEFKDGRTAMFDEFAPKEGKRPVMTDIINVYFDVQKSPLGLKNYQEFATKFPIEAKLFYYHRVPVPR
jgi:hypothetical protein